MSVPREPDGCVRPGSGAGVSARFASAVCAVVAACLNDAVAAPAGDLHAETSAIRGLYRDIRAARDRLAATMAWPAEPTWRDGCLALRIQSPALGAPLAVQVIRRQGTWSAGVAGLRGHAPRAPVDPAGLTVTNDRIGGTLRITLTPYPGRQSDPFHAGNYWDCEPVTWTCAIAGRAKGFLLVGTASLESPGRPVIEGECEGEFHPLVRPRFPDPPLAAEESDPLSEARWLEQAGTFYCEQIRALDVVGAVGLPFAAAFEQIPRYRLVRPAVRSAGGSPSPRKAPQLDDLAPDAALGLDDDRSGLTATSGRRVRIATAWETGWIGRPATPRRRCTPHGTANCGSARW